MKSKRVFVALLLLLALTGLSFKCDGGGGGGVPDPYRNAAKAADDIAAGLNTMTKIKRDLGTSGKLSPDRERTLTDLLLKAVAADRAFIAQIRRLKAAPTATDKGTLCSLFKTLSSALDDLNNTGIVPVDNPDSKSKLATVFTTITKASEIIAAVGLCS